MATVGLTASGLVGTNQISALSPLTLIDDHYKSIQSMDGDNSPSPPENILAQHPSYGQRQQRSFNIIVDLLFAVSFQMLGPVGLKRK